MKYEIRRRNKKDKDIWSPVAWADTWEWANEVASALSCVSDGDFAVFSKDREMMKTMEEAMKL